MQSPKNVISIFDQFSTRQGIPISIEVLVASSDDPSFFVQCTFVDGRALEEIVEASMVRGRTGQMEADNDKYRKQFVKRYFTGWTGLTLGNFIRLLPGRAGTISVAVWYELYPDGEMPFSEKAALELYRETTVEMFFNKIRDGIARAATEYSELKAQEVAAARKNSETSSVSSAA